MTNPKPEDAPDGFWDGLASWLMSDEANKEKVLKLFADKDTAPAPEPVVEPSKTDPPKTKKGWFSSERA